MKTTKKLTALLLVVILTLALSTTAFAQTVATGKGGDASITIENAATSQTYKLYKIFDATVSEDGNIAYTYAGTLATNDFFVQDATTGAITATDDAKDASGNLTADAIEFLGTIKGTAVTSATAADNSLVFTGLEYGYYYIESTLDSGKAVTVTSTKPDASVIDKNNSTPVTPDPDPDDPTKGGAKTVAESSAEVGETVNYTVTFTATNYFTEDAETTQITKYVITDTASGVDLNSDIVVKVDGTTVTTAAKSFDTDGKLVLTWATDAGVSIYNSPATVVITYSGVVTEDALTAGKATNKAVVSYVTADDPTNPEAINEDDPPVETMVFSIDITKVDVDDETTKLDGAKFVLKNSEGSFYKYNADKDDVEWVANQSQADEVTTVGGAAKFEGLKAGTYDLVETKAPSGYNLPSAPFAIVITEESDNTFSATNASESANISDTNRVDATIGNAAGIELPSTGGAGTTMMIVFGSVLFMATAVVLVTKKRLYNQG